MIRPTRLPPVRHLAPLALAAAALLAGCSLLRGPQSAPTRFFVLDATAQPADRLPGRPLAIGFGPLTVPPYLERPEMVRRVAENQLAFDEFNRWGEPLKQNMLRALATDLDLLIGTERMVFYPWYSNTPLDYTVAIAVLRFEPQADGQVALDARWTVGDGRGTVLLNRETRASRPGGTPEQNATAMSALLGELSRQVAVALRDADRGRRE